MRLALMIVICFISIAASSQIKRDSLYYFKKAEEGITLPKQAKWFNAQKQFTVFDIPDRLLFVHVWDPFDINCQASIAEVNRLQDEYVYAVFVSVLSGELTNQLSEKDVMALIGQYNINHPVIVGRDLSGLKLKENQTLPVIKGVRDDAQQYGEFIGEEGIEQLELNLAGLTKVQLETIDLQINDYNASPERKNIKKALNFAQSVAVSKRYGEMYVSDAGNNRILVMGVDGQVIDIIGTGVAGDRDGKWGACQLNHPTFLELDESKDLLYVSDTWNHKVKVVDINQRSIKSLLGNGTRSVRPESRVDSTSAPICFPSGLLLRQGKLLIAMTGHSQVWSYDVSVKSALPLKLSGAELVQPTAIDANQNGEVFIADDSFTHLKKLNDNVLTEVNLFPTDSTAHFGGFGELFFDKDVLYLSQPFQNRILKVKDEKVEVLAGGIAGYEDAKKGKSVQFFHPTGIDIYNKDLIVVDQGNQRLRKAQMKKGKTSTIDFNNYRKLFDGVEAFNEGDKVVLETESIGRGMNSVYIEFELDEKYEWLTDGRNEVFMERAGMNTLISGSPARGFIETEVPGSEMNLYLSVQVYCTVRNKETNEVLFRPILLVVPFEYDASVKTNHDIKWNPFGDL